MVTTYGANSEVGRLRKVIVHRPDLSLMRLTPENKDELLYDDVLWVGQAQKEHDAFVAMMRERGIEVYYHQELLAEALNTSPKARQHAAERTVNHLSVGPALVDTVRSELASWSGEKLAMHLIGGLKRSEFFEDYGSDRLESHSLVAAQADPQAYILPPLPNTLYQRDPAAWLYGGVSLNPLYFHARRLETINQSLVPAARPAAGISSVLFMPITFPLTVGGTTFAFGVSASADVGTAPQRGYLTLAAICYGAVTGITLYLAGRLETRISLRGTLLADRLAGILLTAIAVTLLANGFTDLVTSALHR